MIRELQVPMMDLMVALNASNFFGIISIRHMACGQEGTDGIFMTSFIVLDSGKKHCVIWIAGHT